MLLYWVTFCCERGCFFVFVFVFFPSRVRMQFDCVLRLVCEIISNFRFCMYLSKGYDDCNIFVYFQCGGNWGRGKELVEIKYGHKKHCINWMLSSFVCAKFWGEMNECLLFSVCKEVGKSYLHYSLSLPGLIYWVNLGIHQTRKWYCMNVNTPSLFVP